ncbi:MAG: hypothetical protein BWY17_04125 [Deltaproteobacteria bacterium ADurb.Bin207]|nr:MAG: hypothetical protein BWY17_04125 [Deltaproteobacteria bacterium ADurb.Bin207]HPB98090.1 hypothetical protein [Polyangiaceae bacterium]
MRLAVRTSAKNDVLFEKGAIFDGFRAQRHCPAALYLIEVDALRRPLEGIAPGELPRWTEALS